MISVFLDGRATSRLDFSRSRIAALTAVAQGKKILWELDLALFSENHLFETQSRVLAIDYFIKTLWAEFKDYTEGLSFYRGGLDFDSCLASETLKYLSLAIPDSLRLFLHFEMSSLPPLEQARRTSRALFPRFEIRMNNQPSPFFSLDTTGNTTIGFLLPSRADKLFDDLLRKNLVPRVITEEFLTSEWDGLDTLYVDTFCLSREGLRKLQGFEAAGGEIIDCTDSDI